MGNKSGMYCESGYLRLKSVLQLFPVSKATWWNGCKSGIFPQPYKLCPNVTAWKVSEINELLLSFEKKK